jgi:hypothetical protein
VASHGQDRYWQGEREDCAPTRGTIHGITARVVRTVLHAGKLAKRAGPPASMRTGIASVRIISRLSAHTGPAFHLFLGLGLVSVCDEWPSKRDGNPGAPADELELYRTAARARDVTFGAGACPRPSRIDPSAVLGGDKPRTVC